jgi:hypothetical protein
MKGNHQDLMTQQLPPREEDAFLYEERLDLAESELKVALFFANLSSAAYSTGRLQHATDARSKAVHACTKGAARLAPPEIMAPDAKSVRLILNEVQSALARLPNSGEFNARVRRAG